MSGQIIIGYDGVGKTKAVSKLGIVSYLDLDKSMFKDEEGNLIENWHIPYCNVAWSLAKRGYRVFVSSDEVIINRLKELDKEYREVEDPEDKNPVYIILVFPALELKDEWIERLQDRYDEDPSVDNLASLKRAREYFEKDIESFQNDALENEWFMIELTTTEYELCCKVDIYLSRELLTEKNDLEVNALDPFAPSPLLSEVNATTVEDPVKEITPIVEENYFDYWEDD